MTPEQVALRDNARLHRDVRQLEDRLALKQAQIERLEQMLADTEGYLVTARRERDEARVALTQERTNHVGST